MDDIGTWAEQNYSVGTHFLSALANGDLSGLDNYDCEFLRLWETRIARLEPWHWSFPDDCDAEAFFGRCEITGKMNSVVAIKQMWRGT